MYKTITNPLTGNEIQIGGTKWACSACTFLNASTRRTCEMCKTPKPDEDAEDLIAWNDGDDLEYGHIEGQIPNHCLKHALNHVLQEEKVIIDSENTDIEIEGQINLFGYCYENYVAQGYDTDVDIDTIREQMNNVGLCSSIGDYSSEYAGKVLDFLRFNLNDSQGPGRYAIGPDNPIINWAAVKRDLEHDDCIGLIVLKSETPDFTQGHFTTVSKSVQDCRPQQFTYLDSIPSDTKGRWVCGDINDIIKLLSNGVVREGADEWADMIKIQFDPRNERKWYEEAADRTHFDTFVQERLTQLESQLNGDEEERDDINFDALRAALEREDNTDPDSTKLIAVQDAIYRTRILPPIKAHNIDMIKTYFSTGDEDKDEIINSLLTEYQFQDINVVWNSALNSNSAPEALEWFTNNMHDPHINSQPYNPNIGAVKQIITIFKTTTSYECAACGESAGEESDVSEDEPELTEDAIRELITELETEQTALLERQRELENIIKFN